MRLDRKTTVMMIPTWTETNNVLQEMIIMAITGDLSIIVTSFCISFWTFAFFCCVS
jgi:hypothetical protein